MWSVLVSLWHADALACAVGPARETTESRRRMPGQKRDGCGLTEPIVGIQKAQISDVAPTIYLECPVNGCESVEVDLDPYDVASNADAPKLYALVFPRPNFGQMVRIRGFVEQDNAFECKELITAQEATCTDGLIETTPRMALFRNGPWQLEEKQVRLRDRNAHRKPLHRKA
ncbi:uncharacterized protein BXZ73DRAFT_81910 [Epithele typhae]|uniref:uncharacterized protein n=1 Tax=Epithele typhae TaxID=378194 RepID=UPI0020076E8A|nr:uncharacterized protein BXZ73DRAFT_81910 [Epithele typhae]KAH9913582.1 hypothetical protein BXZ73DRAFT_81910 [Epithele typhae]